MKVAKISLDKIVQVLEQDKRVSFDNGLFTLVTNSLSENPRRIDPYWVPSTSIVWVLEFK